LTRVLAAAVTEDEFLSWPLYWTALFDMSKSIQLELLDPAGGVRSRAVQSRDGRFRITLNGSGSCRSRPTTTRICLCGTGWMRRLSPGCAPMKSSMMSMPAGTRYTNFAHGLSRSGSSSNSCSAAALSL
jgi:hypothetical protein